MQKQNFTDKHSISFFARASNGGDWALGMLLKIRELFAGKGEPDIWAVGGVGTTKPVRLVVGVNNGQEKKRVFFISNYKGFTKLSYQEASKTIDAITSTQSLADSISWLQSLREKVGPLDGAGYFPGDFAEADEVVDDEGEEEAFHDKPVDSAMKQNVSLNQILYGPPGTGKTYETIYAALQILDPAAAAAYKQVDDGKGVSPEQRLVARAALKTRFDQLSAEQRVHFVTFHQSFSYEDFVEGLRAETVNGQLQYRIEAGVFKKICEQARPVPFEKILAKSVVEKFNSSNENFELFSGKYELVTQAISKWAHYISNETRSRLQNTLLKWFSIGVKPNRFYSQAYGPNNIYVYAIGDNLVHESIPDVYYDEGHPLCSFNNNEERKVREVMSILHAIYETSPSSSTMPYSELQSEVSSELNSNNQVDGNHMVSSSCVSDVEMCKDGDIQPYVLIIDEINRGNISRIFGELITLIEPSKRAGAEEALPVTLPYSKEPFYVPGNVYLIGTMNTADRSLAGLDLALRRRFSFTEMPPRPELLKGIKIEGAEGLDLAEMLTKMNQRITVLLDRDHTIGHAYFMPLQKEGSTLAGLAELADIFRQKILPLLQEYFFEDWERIRWVLNDQNKSQKPEVAEAFIIEDKTLDLSGLFKGVHDKLRQSPQWKLNPKAFDNPVAYRGIAANLAETAPSQPAASEATG